jgi:hypothetical protein
MRETRAELVAHVGGKPSAVQSALIERACQLTLRIVAMDRKFAETAHRPITTAGRISPRATA